MGLKTNLAILQLNAQGSKEVASDLRKRVGDSIDVMALQEPYSLAGRVKCYAGLGARVFQPKTETPKAAIVVNNPNIDVLQLNLRDSGHVVAIQVIAGSYDFYLISAYFQFSHSVEPYLMTLARCIKKIRNNNTNSEILICADVNASSTSWFSRDTDRRGEMVEEFIVANNLIVLNQPSIFTTYASPSGKSNIDVTLSTIGMAGHVKGWCISPGTAISDHNAILFRVVSSKVEKFQQQTKDLCFNIKKAKWENFDEDIKAVFGSSFKEKIASLPAQQAVVLWTSTLQDVCRKTFGIRRCRDRAVSWWSEKLTILRKKVQTARAQVSRARRLGLFMDLEQTKNKHRRYRAEYVKEIKYSKMSSWRDFVTEKGNADPWGIVYKILRNKTRNDFNTFHAIEEGMESTTTWRDTVNKLLDKMVPTEKKRGQCSQANNRK